MGLRGRSGEATPLGTATTFSNLLFHIIYSTELVLPTMTLLERPKATRIDQLLQEILEPYDLFAAHTPYGEWKVKPKKKKPGKA